MTVTRIHAERETVPMDEISLSRRNAVRSTRNEDPLHRCNVCGECGVWTKSWSWWGSYRDFEDGVVVKFCSSRCRANGGDPVKLLGKEKRRSPHD